MVDLSFFDRYSLNKETHVYSNVELPRNKYTSVTSLISKYKTPFNAKGAAIGMKKYKKDARSVEEIMLSFEQSREKGTYIHNIIEDKMKGYSFEYPLYKGTQAVFDKFLKNIDLNVLIPVASELIVGDDNLLLCGTIDQLFFNSNTGMYEIWDWKTNEKFTTSSKYKFKKPISFLESSHFNNYSIQLLLYKRLIEQNSDIKIGACKIFHINSKDYTIHKVIMDEKIIDLLIRDYNAK